jgi:hypothetical protein
MLGIEGPRFGSLQVYVENNVIALAGSRISGYVVQQRHNEKAYRQA